MPDIEKVKQKTLTEASWEEIFTLLMLGRLKRGTTPNDPVVLRMGIRMGGGFPTRTWAPRRAALCGLTDKPG